MTEVLVSSTAKRRKTSGGHQIVINMTREEKEYSRDGGWVMFLTDIRSGRWGNGTYWRCAQHYDYGGCTLFQCRVPSKDKVEAAEKITHTGVNHA